MPDVTYAGPATVTVHFHTGRSRVFEPGHPVALGPEEADALEKRAGFTHSVERANRA